MKKSIAAFAVLAAALISHPAPAASADMKIIGRLQVDYSQFDEFFNSVAGDGSDIFHRRARLGVKGEESGWKYKFEYSFKESGDGEFADAYVSREFDEMTAAFGRMKIPFGFNELISSADILAIERSALSNALAPGRASGASVASGGANYSFAFGVFKDGLDDSNDLQMAVAARFTAALLVDGMTVHLGGSWMDSAAAGEAEKLEVRPVRGGGVKKIASGAFDFDGYDKIGLEFGLIAGPLHARFEHIEADYEAAGGGMADADGASFDGWSAIVAWTLSGESRKYKAESGKFGGITPADKEVGAWEIFARWTEFDMRAGGEGADLVGMTYGLNWYPNKKVRVMFNLVQTEDDNAAAGAPSDGDAIVARVQYKF